MKIRYIAPVAMVATGGSDRVSTARGSRVHYHRHRRGDSGPVAGQRADHHSAWGCGAAVRRAAIPVLRIRRRVAVPPRWPPLTAVPFVSPNRSRAEFTASGADPRSAAEVRAVARG